MVFSPLLATDLGYEVTLLSPWFDRIDQRDRGGVGYHFLAKDGVTRYASHIAACASGDAAVIIGFSVGRPPLGIMWRKLHVTLRAVLISFMDRGFAMPST